MADRHRNLHGRKGARMKWLRVYHLVLSLFLSLLSGFREANGVPPEPDTVAQRADADLPELDGPDDRRRGAGSPEPVMVELPTAEGLPGTVTGPEVEIVEPTWRSLRNAGWSIIETLHALALREQRRIERLLGR